MDPPGGPIITSGRMNVRIINAPQYRIIGKSNESTNPQDQITETLKESKIRICMHKPLNVQKPYTYKQAA